jgi:hypothetical protein
MKGKEQNLILELDISAQSRWTGNDLKEIGYGE